MIGQTLSERFGVVRICADYLALKRRRWLISWLTIRDQEESVRADVQRIRNHPLVPRNIPIYGYLYDMKTGRLEEVAEATQIGKAAGR